MRENYTKNAQEAIRLAKSASKHNKQNYTGTEHLLLGLIAEPDGVASKVLRDNNCTLERLNDMIAQLNIRSANLALLDHEGFSPRCQKIMRIAGNLAEQYNSEQVGTEHLLLAIITEGENIALKLIETLGISPPKLYFETLAPTKTILRAAVPPLTQQTRRSFPSTAEISQSSQDRGNLIR